MCIVSKYFLSVCIKCNELYPQIFHSYKASPLVPPSLFSWRMSKTSGPCLVYVLRINDLHIVFTGNIHWPIANKYKPSLSRQCHETMLEMQQVF
uniref:Uncharacterized protein n=1 Tax=Arundo donax TaxID=35708 RepID=A0A0A9AZ59_ARUDO